MNVPTEPTPTGETVSMVSPSDIVSPLGDRMPEVTETKEPVQTTATFAEPPKTVSDQNAGKRDARGTLWNSKRFQVNADGSPRLNDKGNFMWSPEYKGRATKTPRSPTAGSSQPQGNVSFPSFDSPESGERPADPNLPPLQDEYDLAAEVYLHSAYGPIIIAFSEHARPDREDHAALKQALANYLRVKQIKEPSPGWGLCLVAVAVAVKKSAHPEVQKRAATWGERLKAWFNPQKFKAPAKVESPS